MAYDVLLKEIDKVLKEKNTQISLLEYQVRDLKNKIEQLEQNSKEGKSA